jgi:hypothetical protein
MDNLDPVTMAALQELAGEVNNATVTMICNGRARAGWAIVIIWPDSENPVRFTVSHHPPGTQIDEPPRGKCEVIYPGGLLAAESPL